MARISEISGPETSGPSPWAQSASVARSRRPADPPFRPDQEVGVLPAVGHGHQGRLRRRCSRPSGRRMSSPCTTISPSMAMTGAGGWLVVVVRARRRRTSSSGPMAGQAPGAPVGEDVEPEAGRDQLLVEVTGVCSAAARTWPAVSWTDQPSHQDGAAHGRADRAAQVSAIWARSEWMCSHVSSFFIRLPLRRSSGSPSVVHPVRSRCRPVTSLYTYDERGSPGSTPRYGGCDPVLSHGPGRGEETVARPAGHPSPARGLRGARRPPRRNRCAHRGGSGSWSGWRRRGGVVHVHLCVPSRACQLFPGWLGGPGSSGGFAPAGRSLGAGSGSGSATAPGPGPSSSRMPYRA